MPVGGEGSLSSPLRGTCTFVGQGLERPVPLDESLSYDVPAGSPAHVTHFRAGNSSGELVAVLLLLDGAPVRYFPVGARGDVDVPWRGRDDVAAAGRLSLAVAAPLGVSGEVSVDVGLG